MEYIKVTNENIEKEHICCAISNNNDIQVSSKKAWLSERFEDGLVFLKSTERGKCFIEYIPAENAWNPILADGYMYIDCLWVAGSFKGHGYSTDPKFLKYKGYTVCDEADNGIQLWYYPFDENVELPKFKECAKQPYIEEKGYVLYYTSQCPFNAKYVPVIEDIAKEKSVQFKAIHLQSKEEAQNAPTPITTYALFLDGDYITNEQMNDKRFLKLLEKQSFNNTER